MPNVLLKIQYDGTQYHGWQVQKNAITVQEVFQDALGTFFGQRPDVKGCSRTDSGVHALEYAVSSVLPRFDGEYNLLSALNNILPPDIRVTSAEVVDDDFHARYNSKGKEYIYTIYNNRVSNPFIDRYSYLYKHKIDEKLLDTAAKHFIGTFDFGGFCNIKCDIEDTIRTVYDFSVKRKGNIVTFTVSADGFLYNMVRIMVGTLLAVNSGRIREEDLDEVILSKDRKRAGQTVPAKGLILNRVFY